MASYSDGQGLSGQKTFSLTIQNVTFNAVSAGDVTASDVILWTRIQQTGPAVLTAEVTTDLNFGTFQSFGGTVDPAQDYTLKVNATGLNAGTRYYYRFAGQNGELSNVGTFNTAYAPNVKAAVRFAFSGDCDGQARDTVCEFKRDRPSVNTVPQ